MSSVENVAQVTQNFARFQMSATFSAFKVIQIFCRRDYLPCFKFEQRTISGFSSIATVANGFTQVVVTFSKLTIETLETYCIKLIVL